MFYILRLIGGVLIVTPIYYIRSRRRDKANLRNYLILAAVIISLLMFVPFENVFISFNSPEDSYRYFNMTTPDVKLVIEGTDSDLVVGNNDGADSPFLVPKNEKGWKLGTGINAIPIVNKTIKGCLVNVYHAIGSEDYYLIIYNLTFDSLVISDTINSKFIKFENYASEFDETYTTYYTVLPSKDKQYKLCINGEEYSIF